MRSNRQSCPLWTFLGILYAFLVANSGVVNDYSSLDVSKIDQEQTVRWKNPPKHAVSKASRSQSFPAISGIGNNATKKAEEFILDYLRPESPLFVFGLPNSRSLVFRRFFKCAGLPASDVGRHFTPNGKQREGSIIRRDQEEGTIGSCMRHNLKGGRPTLYQCGNFKVWLDMDVARMGQCYYLSIAIGGLKALAVGYPQATILHVKRDPNIWYETLSHDIRHQWHDMCQPYHPDVKFPAGNSSKGEWIKFYHAHVDRIRTFAQEHPSLHYIGISLDLYRANETALALQEQLGVEPQCWHDSIISQEFNITQPRQRPSDRSDPFLISTLAQ